MRVPQVSERIKEAPAQALRGVFAGIGQLLLYTDKLRNKAPYPHVPAAPPTPTPRPEPEEPVRVPATASAPPEPDVVAEPAATQTPETPKTPPAPKTPAPVTEIRDFDKTGNVRLITADEARQDDGPEPAVAAAGERAPASAEKSAAEPEPPAPPLPNYDELSLASLRARLKNLDVTRLRSLIEYEKGHAGRADVLVMFERRIAKLQAGE
jgi:hypothetical protein